MTAEKKASAFGQLPSGPSAMSDMERELHIKSCSNHFLAAYARFEDSGLPADRAAAYEWLEMRDDAIRDRSQAQKQVIAAAVDRRIDEGNNYFAGAAHDSSPMHSKMEQHV